MNSKEKSVLSFYTLAANLYCSVASKKSTITSLALASNVRQKKQMYALLKQCHKNISLIVQIAERANIFNDATINLCKKDHSLTCILIHDLLWNSELCRNKGKMAIFLAAFPRIDSCKTRIRAEWTRLLVAGTAYKGPCLDSLKIKYARINTLLCAESDSSKVIDYLRTLNPGPICIDSLIPNLIKFENIPATFQFHRCPLVKEGKLIVQDRASSLPALFLDPPHGSVVLDACAAPGNKTTQLAAIMANSGTIIAVEQNLKRFELLKSNIALASASASTLCVNADFLQINVEKDPYKKVEYILLDPSCSGSWMSSRDEDAWNTGSSSSRVPKEELDQRIGKLSAFQEMALEKAMKFPNVKRIVYSTCSTNEQENEIVIANVLSKNPNFVLKDIPTFLSSWSRRGTNGLPTGFVLI